MNTCGKSSLLSTIRSLCLLQESQDSGIAASSASLHPIGKEQITVAASAKTTQLDLLLRDAYGQQLRLVRSGKIKPEGRSQGVNLIWYHHLGKTSVHTRHRTS